MRFISLLITLLILGLVVMSYLKPSKTGTDQISSRPKETIDRAEQRVNQTIEDYQKKLKKLDNQ